MSLMDNKTWGGWWFLNGGSIHGLWKRRRYTEIRDKVHEIANAAWFHQQDRINTIEKRLVELTDIVEYAKAKVDVPKDEYEFSVLLRKEYERGVEAAANLMEQDFRTVPRGVQIRDTLLMRTSETQRSQPLMGEIGKTMNDNLEVYIIPKDSFIQVVVGKPGSVFKPPFYATIVDTIFQVQDAVSHCRTKLLRSMNGNEGIDSGKNGADELPKET